MTPTKFLIGQICVVFAVAIGGVWFATEWAAWHLGFQVQLGTPWFTMLSFPFYYPWRLFEWWYTYDAYAHQKPTLYGNASRTMTTATKNNDCTPARRCVHIMF